MLADRKQIIFPEIYARNAIEVIISFFSGQIIDISPTKIPIDPGLANPQQAYVAIAELLVFCNIIKYIIQFNK